MLEECWLWSLWLPVRALMKFELLSLTRLNENRAIDTVIVEEALISVFLLSAVKSTFLSRDTKPIFTTEVSGMTRGLTFRLCGAIGAIMSTFASGSTIGPPTLREYAVEPELVATSSPSDQYTGRLLPSMLTVMPSVAAPERCTVTSFNA